jgi:hypothetical protein
LVKLDEFLFAMEVVSSARRSRVHVSPCIAREQKSMVDVCEKEHLASSTPFQVREVDVASVELQFGDDVE